MIKGFLREIQCRTGEECSLSGGGLGLERSCLGLGSIPPYHNLSKLKGYQALDYPLVCSSCDRALKSLQAPNLFYQIAKSFSSSDLDIPVN